MATETQETRSMIVALKVTPSEKRRIEWVAGMRGQDVSTLLRDLAIDPIMVEHKRFSEALQATGT